MGDVLCIDVTQLAQEISSQLNAFKNGIRADMKRAVDDGAEKLKGDLRESSPRRTRRDAYATHWRVKKGDSTSLFYSVTVHNDKKYQLTHLLENGHVIKPHGRERGFGGRRVHIKPASERALSEFEKDCVGIIKARGGI